jgi:hypothetical protein
MGGHDDSRFLGCRSRAHRHTILGHLVLDNCDGRLTTGPEVCLERDSRLRGRDVRDQFP